MSTFALRTVQCPNCHDTRDREVATSINASRSPARRDEILSGTFQVFTCEVCGHPIVYTGEFPYLDLDRRQFIGVFPSAWETDWDRYEARAETAFGRTLGTEAPSVAQSLASDVAVRCVFGLPALREKLIAADERFDDRLVEAFKLSLFETVAGLPFEAGRRPRLVAADADTLVFAIPADPSDPDQDPLRLPIERTRFDDFVARADRDELLAAIAPGAYVDTGRLLIPGSRAAS
jgi:CpXC protein